MQSGIDNIDVMRWVFSEISKKYL